MLRLKGDLPDLFVKGFFDLPDLFKTKAFF